MFLVRKLYFFAAQAGFSISLKHIMGINNSTADALSRFQVHRFREVAPEAEAQPTILPNAVTQLLQEAVHIIP